MRLMIVDDHEGVRLMIRNLVAAPGDMLLECSSGDEAVRHAAVFRPDCVTLDIHMPGQNAFAAAHAIRAALPETRIIIVTSYDQADLRRAALAAGAVGYVVKDDLAELPRVLSCVMPQTNL